MTSECPKRPRAKRTRSQMAERTPCLRRCSTIRAPSPNHEGVEGTDRDVVWMLTDPSAILFMCASLMEVVLFFLLKEAHFYPCSLQVPSRCASRGFCWPRRRDEPPNAFPR